MKKPVRVAITGAAGQIGYALLFRIAAGEMLGKDQPVSLQLLEIPNEKTQKVLQGVMMELQDCAFPLLADMQAHSDPMSAFKDADLAFGRQCAPVAPHPWPRPLFVAGRRKGQRRDMPGVHP